jgi:sortase A
VIAAVAAVLVFAVLAGLLVQIVRGRSTVTATPVAVPSPAVRAPAVERPRDPVGRIVHSIRHRRWLRWTLSGVSVVLLAVAVGMLGYPFYTNLYQARVQSRLDRQLASPELKQAYEAGQVEVGDSLTRIKIPAIGVDVVVVEGTTSSALRAGAGHYPETPLPCEQGNVAIAGHRTTYGRPFHNLDRIKPGDTVTLETPVGSCTYRVQKDPFIVAPTDGTVVEPTPSPTLTLTTCHPKGSARQRLILQAVLEGQPVAA